MRILLMISFFSASFAFGQTNLIRVDYAERLRGLNYVQLNRLVQQQAKIKRLQLELEEAKRMGEINRELIEKLREENVILRQQMDDYRKKVEELNKENEEKAKELKGD